MADARNDLKFAVRQQLKKPVLVRERCDFVLFARDQKHWKR